ncbi:MAG TPA: EamA/RhaT family transporter [Desulfobacteraceae bacterium]|nr:EamA/RhaT family transporter [Desulfobacteraceae bacterium]
MTHQISAWANLTLAMIIVGSSVVFGKVITSEFPVFLASCIRFAIASAVMLPLLIKTEGAFYRPGRQDLRRLIGMAFCGQFVFTALVLLGLRYTSAIEAGIITSTSPAMMAVVAFFLFRERPAFFQVAAVLLAVGGVISVNGLTGSGLSTDHLTGNLMMVGAVVGEAVFLLMRKSISKALSNMALTAYLCFTGFIMFLPFALYQGIDFKFSAVSAGAWWAMMYFGAVFTVLAYIFWFRGVSRVSGAVAGIFSAVMPVSGVVLSCLFLKESFTFSHGIGMAMVLSGIVIMALAPRKRSAGKEPAPVSESV